MRDTVIIATRSLDAVAPRRRRAGVYVPLSAPNYGSSRTDASAHVLVRAVVVKLESLLGATRPRGG